MSAQCSLRPQAGKQSLMLALQPSVASPRSKHVVPKYSVSGKQAVCSPQQPPDQGVLPGSGPADAPGVLLRPPRGRLPALCVGGRAQQPGHQAGARPGRPGACGPCHCQGVATWQRGYTSRPEHLSIRAFTVAASWWQSGGVLAAAPCWESAGATLLCRGGPAPQVRRATCSQPAEPDGPADLLGTSSRLRCRPVLGADHPNTNRLQGQHTNDKSLNPKPETRKWVAGPDLSSPKVLCMQGS